MVRYTAAALVRITIWAGFWVIIWLIFGSTPLNILIFIAILIAIFILSFVAPFLMLIEVQYGRIEGPDGFASSAVELAEVDWSRSTANSFAVHIQAFDGRAVTAERCHFSAEELEEMYLTFIGGNSAESDRSEETSGFDELGYSPPNAELCRFGDSSP